MPTYSDFDKSVKRRIVGSENVSDRVLDREFYTVNSMS